MNLLQVIIFGAAFGLTSGAGVLPDSLHAAVGDSVTFTTSLGPTPTPFTSILWKFDNKDIIIRSAENNNTAPEYESRITLFESGSLHLINVTINDTGEYNVTIITADGAQVNGLTNLTVWEIISEARVSAPTQLPSENTPLNIACDASGFVSNREWMKNGLPLKSSENIMFYNEKQDLSFRALSRKDTGVYTCNISNPVSSQEETLPIVVIYGPENVEIQVQIDAEFKLSCSAESEPDASYIWMKNGTTISHSSEFSKNTSEYSDSGEYICRATNQITMITSEISHRIIIIDGPKAGLSPGAIAGITVGCLVAVVGAAVGGFFIYKCCARKRQKRNNVNGPAPSETTRATNFYTEDQHVYENAERIYDKDL